VVFCQQGVIRWVDLLSNVNVRFEVGKGRNGRGHKSTEPLGAGEATV